MPKKEKERKSLEQTIWDSANKLRGAVEPSEYKHVVLSLIFLKYANDRFDEQRKKMVKDGHEAFLEMLPFYTQDNVFFIPEKARWSYIMENAKQTDIAIKIDTALHEIETANKALAGALPDNYYSRLHIDTGALSSLRVITQIMIGRIQVRKSSSGSILNLMTGKITIVLTMNARRGCRLTNLFQ